jgi:hypothetical protein
VRGLVPEHRHSQASSQFQRLITLEEKGCGARPQGYRVQGPTLGFRDRLQQGLLEVGHRVQPCLAGSSRVRDQADAKGISGDRLGSRLCQQRKEPHKQAEPEAATKRGKNVHEHS